MAIFFFYSKHIQILRSLPKFAKVDKNDDKLHAKKLNAIKPYRSGIKSNHSPIQSRYRQCNQGIAQRNQGVLLEEGSSF